MIYIQSDSDRILPHHFDVSSVLYGAIDTAQDYRLTTIEEVMSGKFDTVIKRHLFVGSVEFMNEVFNRVDISDPRVPMNSNREHTISTLENAHLRVSKGGTLFIKPYKIKLFSGLVLDGCKYSCLVNLPGDTKVMIYEVFDNPLSEWRIYIHRGKIEDARNYSGDVMLMPDKDYINSVIENCVDFPISYTIDIGILEKENIVVEFNDMWAIGNYGVPNDIYLRMIKDRYFEIIKTS